MNSRPHVTTDPAQRFGQPHVKGVTVEAIGGHIWGGDPVDTVADDYGLTRADILVACWWLARHGTRAWRRRWHTWLVEVEPSLWAASTVDYNAIPDPPVGGDR